MIFYHYFLSSNKENLWKCLWKSGNGPNFVKDDAHSIGEEEVSFTFADEDRTIIKGSTNKTYDYDYKGDKDLEDGRTQILAFMEELNNLPNCTDGNNDDKRATNEIVKESSYKNIFIQFVGIGNERFDYLERLDDLSGRPVDNTGFIKVADMERLSDEQLFEMLLDQYPDWLRNKRV